MSLKYYRGIEFVQDFMVKFLNTIFSANQKGQIDFFDGVKIAKFSTQPYVLKKSSWDFRSLPCILISYSSAHLDFLTFEKDFLGEDKPDYAWKEYGGQIFVSLTLDIWAFSVEERDKLVDIVSIFLSGPTAKDFFYKHDIIIPKGPNISESEPRNEPGIDHPVFISNLSLETVGSWRDREDQNSPLLSEVVVDIEAEMDFDP
jgi:hypothetical protein